MIGIADTGLDTDHGQFRYSPIRLLKPMLCRYHSPYKWFALPVRITNPNNKVIAYYLIGTGQTKDLAAAVNGGITLDPDDKADTYYRECSSL